MTVETAPQGEFYSGPNPRGAVALPNSPSVGEWKIPARSQTDVAPQPNRYCLMSNTSHDVSRNRPAGENQTSRPSYGTVVQLVRTPACHAGGRGFKSLLCRHSCTDAARCATKPFSFSLTLPGDISPGTLCRSCGHDCVGGSTGGGLLAP